MLVLLHCRCITHVYATEEKSGQGRNEREGSLKRERERERGEKDGCKTRVANAWIDRREIKLPI